MGEDFKEYCISYQHKGASWGAQVLATSFEDARARVRAIGTTGVVDGELVMTVPARFGIWVPLLCWFRNLFRSRA